MRQQGQRQGPLPAPDTPARGLFAGRGRVTGRAVHVLCQRLLRRGGAPAAGPGCDARRHRDRNGMIKIPEQARPLSTPSSAKPTAISADGDASPLERPGRFTFQTREGVLFQSAGLPRIPAPWAPALNRTVREITETSLWAGSRPRDAGRAPAGSSRTAADAAVTSAGPLPWRGARPGTATGQRHCPGQRAAAGCPTQSGATSAYHVPAPRIHLPEPVRRGLPAAAA